MLIQNFKSKLLSTKDRISDFTLLLLCVLVVVFLTPIVARNIPNVLILGLMGLLVISVLPRIKCLSKYELVTLLVLAAYMVIQTLYKFLGKSSAELYYYFNTVQYFFFFGAIMAVYAALSAPQRKVLIFVTVGIMMITMLDNVRLLYEYGPAKYVTLYQWAKYTTNSTNTQFAFAVLLFGGGALMYGMYEKKLVWKILSAVIIAFSLYYIVAVAQRTIVMILAALLLPLLVVANFYAPPKRLSQKMKIGLIVGGLIVIVLVCVFYKPILLGIGKLAGSARVTKRINQIIMLLETGDIQEAGGSLTVRYNLIMRSWDTFTSSLSNFLLGAGDHRATNEIIGNHSQIFDELARYGIVGSAVVFWLFARIFKVMKKMSGVCPGTRENRFLNVFLFIFALRALLGSVLDVSIAIHMFVLIPLLLKTISEGEKTAGNQAA